jgi:hypothetical protein
MRKGMTIRIAGSPYTWIGYRAGVLRSRSKRSGVWLSRGPVAIRQEGGKHVASGMATVNEYMDGAR